MRHRVWTWIEDYYSKIGGKDMEKSALEITDDQKQKLMATILQDGTTALDYVISWSKADQPWALAGVLSCIGKGYSLNRLTINWEARELRYGK